MQNCTLRLIAVVIALFLLPASYAAEDTWCDWDIHGSSTPDSICSDARGKTRKVTRNTKENPYQKIFKKYVDAKSNTSETGHAEVNQRPCDERSCNRTCEVYDNETNDWVSC